MTARYAFFWYPKFFATLVTLVGLLGSYMVLPAGGIADPRQKGVTGFCIANNSGAEAEDWAKKGLGPLRGSQKFRRRLNRQY